MILGLKSSVAVLAGTAALAAPAPQSRPVFVLDGSLQQAHVTISVGGSVTWINVGTRRHRIASDTRAWPSFTLRRGGHRAIRFTRAGHYPYHVDGARKGLVVVVAFSSPNGKTGGAWAGTFTSADRNVGSAQTCSAMWKGKLTFTVAKGKLSGTGEASLSGTPSCSVKLPRPEISHVTFTVDGTESGTTFRLLMHPRTIQPSHARAYDAGGFLVHFGKHGEGTPLVLAVRGNSVDARITKHLANVTLRDHVVLSRSK